MLATIAHKGKTYKANLLQPIDISLPVTADGNNPVAWYLGQPEISPVQMDGWTGNVAKGASTNFNTIVFNPHAHGTHTECLGHITRGFYSVNQSLKNFFSIAELISITPEENSNDLVISKEQIEKALSGTAPEALVIRTLPNTDAKKHKNYSHTNPPYISEEAAAYICGLGIQHLLTDLPSVDREEDGGRLVAHKAFWNVTDINNLNHDARLDATITEMVFVADAIADGSYLLNLQIASFENDAAPGKPVLYALLES